MTMNQVLYKKCRYCLLRLRPQSGFRSPDSVCHSFSTTELFAARLDKIILVHHLYALLCDKISLLSSRSSHRVEILVSDCYIPSELLNLSTPDLMR